MKRRGFPKKGMDQSELMSRIEEIRSKDTDFADGTIFGSMCTSPLDMAKKVHGLFLETNLGNPGLYRGTLELEKEIHSSVASLLNAPEGYEALSVGGATEGNILALWSSREKTGKRKVIIPESAHFSFKKACNLLDMEPVMIPLDDKYQPDLSTVEEEIDDDTAVVVAIAGTTELGLIDPIHDLADISGDVHLHVDAAFGGFAIPFLKEAGYSLPEFDLSIDGVDSIVLDPHKLGMSTIPLGLYYSREEHPIAIESPYLTGAHQKTIPGTRASASIPAFWSVMNYLGFEGYVSIMERCMNNTRTLLMKGKEIGLEPIVDPVLNIVSFHHEDPVRVVETMERKGLSISRTVNPPGLRFVVMPHVTEESILKMIPILEDSI